MARDVYKMFNDTVDKITVKSKVSYPYNYDSIIQWSNGLESFNSVYTDRLFQWDCNKHDKLCIKYFDNRSQYWNNREPKKVEAFLRDYLEMSELKLCMITEHCNKATGFPLWRLDYRNIN